MEMNDSSSQESQHATIVKKTYEKPCFRYEHVFVTSALSCGKISPLDKSCISPPSAS
jgi:hypothetical protein